MTDTLERLTPAERGVVTKARNRLKQVDYASTSATIIHQLLAIIDRIAPVKGSK